MSDSGVAYWGRYGAAGLLLRAPRPDGTPAVLLQHRALWSHQGGTWGLPGGARDSHETPEQTAVRESSEEAGLSAERLEVRATVVTAEVCGVDDTHWTYTTVVADAGELLDTVPNRESAELRWVADRERGGRLAVTSRIRRQLATTADRSGDRATGPVRRTAAAAAAHHSDRGRGFPLVYAGRRGSGALAAG